MCALHFAVCLALLVHVCPAGQSDAPLGIDSPTDLLQGIGVTQIMPGPGLQSTGRFVMV